MRNERYDFEETEYLDNEWMSYGLYGHGFA